MAIAVPQIDKEVLAKFCRHNKIKRLSLFGSALTERFTESSDIDLLVEYEPGAIVGYMEMVRMEIELTELYGRKVDLRTPAELSRYFRQDVLNKAVLQYAGG